jgi:hypothetical protein
LKRNRRLQFACRLCLELGIDDPEQWLESAPPRVVSLWEAYDKLEPFGMPWHRDAVTQSLLHGVLTYHYASHRIKIKPLGFDDFMPPQYTPLKKPKKKRELAVFGALASMAAKITGKKKE